MSKCGKKVKNPCKMCLQPVTQKTGLQCQGACLSWVHYSCLNYTPGRIRDIKNGFIKVTCPCPDCKTKYPKEYRTDEPFACNNQQCPANQPPMCDNIACPSNADNPYNISPPNTAPLSKCGASCQKHGITQTQATSNSQFSNQGSTTSGNGNSVCPSGDVGGRQMGGIDPIQAVEKMCNTVGQLTTQINELMCQMKQAMQEQMNPGGGGGFAKGNNCVQKGPKSKCPKPCFCPGNPVGKK